jgi:hypothetical protein
MSHVLLFPVLEQVLRYKFLSKPVLDIYEKCFLQTHESSFNRKKILVITISPIEYYLALL